MNNFLHMGNPFEKIGNVSKTNGTEGAKLLTSDSDYLL